VKRVNAVLSIVFCAALAIATPISAKISVEAQIKEDLQTMETVLNNKSDVQKLLTFFHTFIDESANFDISVQNPTLPENMQANSFSMNKEQFINSFLQGTQNIQNYSVSVNVEKVVQNQDKVTSAHTLIERGVVSNPMDPTETGKAFISETKCLSNYDANAKTIAVKDSMCKTTVSFEEEI